MSQSSEPPSGPQFVWICPQCSRKVPQRLDVCRCGFQRDSDGFDGAFEPAEGGASLALLAPPAPSAPHFRWLVLVGVAGAVIGLLLALEMLRKPPAPEAPPSTRLDTSMAPPQAVAPAPAPAPAQTPAAAVIIPRPVAVPDSPAPAPVPRIAAPPAATNSDSALEDVISNSIPAIVSIETNEGRGSGFFAAPQTVVTNRHVVGANGSVTVRLASGATLPGRVEKTSQEFDLAIVHVDGASPTQPVLPLGSVNSVRAGQEVIAIGLALGVFQNTVTRGIVSAIRRAGSTVMLQTDAAINPGNSGGPLLNRNGQVIGINALKISGSAESLGFAIAIDHAKSLLAGGQPADASFTNAPRASNEQLAPSFTSRSSADEARETGARAFEQTVQQAARQASQLDNYWIRIKTDCAMRVAPGYDREWFGLWDGRAALTSADSSCASAVREANDLAAAIRAAMVKGQEDARHASVLPGQLRDIRHRYRMDWPGFDR